VKALLRWQATKNFASGFVTGLGGLLIPPVAVPAALGACWVLQARLAAATAALHGHSLGGDRVRTLLLLAIRGDAAGKVVKSAVWSSGRSSRRMPSVPCPAALSWRATSAWGFGC
jgi:hypothetical protein